MCCSSTRSRSGRDRVDFQPLLLVDGATVTSDAAKLAKGGRHRRGRQPGQGPKITIMRFKNKTGYRKHRATASTDPGQDHRDRRLSHEHRQD